MKTTANTRHTRKTPGPERFPRSEDAHRGCRHRGPVNTAQIASDIRDAEAAVRLARVIMYCVAGELRQAPEIHRAVRGFEKKAGALEVVAADIQKKLVSRSRRQSTLSRSAAT